MRERIEGRRGKAEELKGSISKYFTKMGIVTSFEVEHIDNEEEKLLLQDEFLPLNTILRIR